MQTPSIIEAYIDNNIFEFRKGDGVAYLVFYVLLPITIGIITLLEFPSETVAGIYCYVTLLVSTFNCLYDAGNRWSTGEKKLKNTKLFFMMLFAAIVAGYCIVVILRSLATQNIFHMCDWILAGYFVVALISTIDSIICFAVDMAWRNCVRSALPKEEEGGQK